MTITRMDAETELAARCASWMAAASLLSDASGFNTNYQSPLAYALRRMGLSFSNPVTSAQLALIADADLDQFYDLAELRLLKNIQGNYSAVDFRLGPRGENFNQLRQAIAATITELETRIESEYGLGGATLTAGLLRIDFAEHDDGSSSPDLEE